MIAAARRKFQTARWYPKGAGEEPNRRKLDFAKFENEYMVHSRLKEKWINIAGAGQPPMRIRFVHAGGTHWPGLLASLTGQTSTRPVTMSADDGIAQSHGLNWHVS